MVHPNPSLSSLLQTMLVNKVIKPGGGEPDEFERSIGQALLELEVNSEMKPQLRDLHITRAKEIECDNKKVGTRCCPVLYAT